MTGYSEAGESAPLRPGGLCGSRFPYGRRSSQNSARSPAPSGPVPRWRQSTAAPHPLGLVRGPFLRLCRIIPSVAVVPCEFPRYGAGRPLAEPRYRPRQHSCLPPHPDKHTRSLLPMRQCPHPFLLALDTRSICAAAGLFPRVSKKANPNPTADLQTLPRGVASVA